MRVIPEEKSDRNWPWSSPQVQILSQVERNPESLGPQPGEVSQGESLNWSSGYFKRLSGWSYDKPRECIKKHRHHFANKGPSSQRYGFSSSHVGMWELDYKESWVPKNWCFWTVVLEKTLESPLECKEIQPVHPKGNQSWIFIGRTDAEAETPVLWPPDTKNWLIGKDPDAGKDWRQEEKGTTEDEMASLTRCTWVWVSSTSWWRTGKPGILQSIGVQRVRQNWATEHQQDKVNPVRSPLVLQRYNLETPWGNNGCYEAIPDVSGGLLLFLFNKATITVLS